MGTVKELIDVCGEFLLKCFSQQQIDDTKSKQMLGIKAILSNHLTEQKIVECFIFKNDEDGQALNEEEVTTEIIDDFTPASTTTAAVKETHDIIEQKISSDKTSTTTPTIVSKISTTTLASSSTSTSFSTTTFQSSTLQNDIPINITNDQATTPSSVLKKCDEAEYKRIRETYERCAGNKIREITAWLERRERTRRSNDYDTEDGEKKSILNVCDAVRQLLYDCGDELGWCFTENQVTETRYKQKAGLQDILSKYYSEEALKMCFIQKATVTTPFLESTTSQETTENDIDEDSLNYRRPKHFATRHSGSHAVMHTAHFILFYVTLFAFVI